MSRAKKQIDHMPQPKAGDRTIPIELDHALVVRFRPDAAVRGTSVTRLIHDILATIADDQLTSAVLADQPPFD